MPLALIMSTIQWFVTSQRNHTQFNMCKILSTTCIIYLCIISPVLCQSIYNSNWTIMRQIFESFLGTTQQSTAKVQYPSLDDNYDFIIIGSGSSGAVVANRLSEISSWKILLLEAGNPGNVLTQVPLLAPLFQLTPYNWNYTMQRQDGLCLAMEDQICALPRGRALGGSSIINYMAYTRGNPTDYNSWFEKGNQGWSYEEVLPYFLKSEKCKLGNLCASRYHNHDGYLSIEHPFKSRITDAFLEAGVELGEKIIDYNTPEFMGYAPVQATMNFGRRHSTADAFLNPINCRRNLNIITSARVTKILIDPIMKTAQGVIFKKRGKTFMVKASKEVILSAGSLSSPQLLMLSGIGPQEHLQELKIPIIHNLPVGQLLYDHVSVAGLSFKFNQTVEPRETVVNPSEMLRWVFKGKGLFTSPGGLDAVAYINTGSIPHNNHPDIELIFVGAGFVPGADSLHLDYGLVIAKLLRLRPDVYNAVFRPLEQIPSWSIFPMLLHPNSRGYLKLKSSNPYEQPLFYGNYYTDPEEKDIKTMLASIRYIQKLSQTTAFQKFGSQIHDTPVPGCEHFIFDSNDYWFCVLRRLTLTFHHQIGTCKMGPIDDEEAVVDNRLRVHGIKQLRVIDASIMPSTVSGHTHAPSIMIGEKGSDIIKEDWGVISY